MKKLKFLAAGCCMATMCLTSCLSNDNDSTTGLTKEETAYCLATVRGNYNGDLIYIAKNVKDVNDNTDTLKISWSIVNDSTMTIYDFPAKLLADNVSDEKLKAALEEAPDKDISCYIGFVNNKPVQYLINPKSPEYTLNHDGKDHKIQVAFYVNNTASFGSYNSTKKELYMQIVEGAIFMDGKQTAYLTQQNPFAFVAKKD